MALAADLIERIAYERTVAETLTLVKADLLATVTALVDEHVAAGSDEATVEAVAIDLMNADTGADQEPAGLTAEGSTEFQARIAELNGRAAVWFRQRLAIQTAAIARDTWWADQFAEHRSHRIASSILSDEWLEALLSEAYAAMRADITAGARTLVEEYPKRVVGLVRASDVTLSTGVRQWLRSCVANSSTE